MKPFQCISCGLNFPAMLDYYRHRLVSGPATRCMTPDEMFFDRIHTTAAADGEPVGATIITAPRMKQRSETEKRPSVEQLLGHASIDCSQCYVNIDQDTLCSVFKSTL